MIHSAPSRSAQSVRLIARSSFLAAAVLAFSSLAYAQGDIEDGLKDIEVTIKAGETFSGILSRELNSLDAWGEVVKHNKLESPDELRPGDVLVIPVEVIRSGNYATVVFVKGIATLESRLGNDSEQIVKGDKVFVGDSIETLADGFVSVAFNGGSSVNIQPESSMRISVLKCVDTEISCEIKLESEGGRLGLDVRNTGFQKPTVFSVDSPFASAAVRGTRFDFDVDGGNAMGVTEGSVDISFNGASNSVAVGKGVLAGEGRSISQLFDLVSEPVLRLKDDGNRISDQDVVSWENLSGAESYMVAYTDISNPDDVPQFKSFDGNITKPDLPVGEYMIHVRGVDSNGLRGFTNSKRFTMVSMDESNDSADVAVEAIIADSEMQLSVPDATGPVEVKVGNSIEMIDSREYIVGNNTFTLEPGGTVSVDVSGEDDWFLQAREVMDENTVSPYGLLYIFDLNEQ